MGRKKKKEYDVEIEMPEYDDKNISSVIKTLAELKSVKEAVTEKIDVVEKNLKDIMKERKWDNYKDEISQISVSISVDKKETINKKALKMLLNEEQYGQVIVVKSFENIVLVTPEDRERLRKYGKK